MNIVSSLDQTNANRENDRECDGYPQFLESIRATFVKAVQAPLFTTDATGMFETFLMSLPENAQQHYNCYACREFIEKYGGLVNVVDGGERLMSALWDAGDVPEFFKSAVYSLHLRIKRAKITGIFLADRTVLGVPTAGGFDHMSVSVPERFLWRYKRQSASQRMAELLTDYSMIRDYLAHNKETAIIQTAINLLKSGVLNRAEKVLPHAEWLLARHKDHSRYGLWAAVAEAPAGFCHINTTVLGSMREDISHLANDRDEIIARFNAKMSPLQYQRSQVAPTQGNIDQAEKIIAQLGIARSLERRYATLDDVRKVWEPKPFKEAKQSTGVFASVRAKDQPLRFTDLDLPPQRMTWVKFEATVLPNVQWMELLVENGFNTFGAFVTAEHPDAPPILRWDIDGNRNPVSTYFRVTKTITGLTGSTPDSWNLRPGFVPVTAICFSPHMWTLPDTEKMVYFILDGARDNFYAHIGNALFPETLRGELREVRATIEAYSKNARITGYENSNVAGLGKGSGNQNWNVVLRTLTGTVFSKYLLDRWD